MQIETRQGAVMLNTSLDVVLHEVARPQELDAVPVLLQSHVVLRLALELKHHRAHLQVWPLIAHNHSQTNKLQCHPLLRY